MRGKIGDKVRLQHILEEIIEIETYSLNTFRFHEKFYDEICMYQMESIGEASNHVSDWDIGYSF